MAKSNKKKQETGSNHEYINMIWIFTGLFALMIGYLCTFQAVKSRETINNSYNARLELFEEKVIRGKIYASDGETLAFTRVGNDGSEKRVYPYGNMFAHVIGYSEYGKTGIENYGNFQLLTSNAFFLERFINEFKEQKNIGDNLVTTLDVKLQAAAYQALGSQKGAVVVLEPSTGNVRAMVSKPDFDPGQIVSKWDEFSVSDESLLLNRATQGLYPPGSTFKTVTLLAYLREHRMRENMFSYDCKGKATAGDFSLQCYNGTVHGELSLKDAYVKSCNSAFADIGRSLDINRFSTLTKELLFDSDLPIPFSYRQSSFQLKEDDTEALKMMTAIGQGKTLVTPMHMAMIVSAIANNGILMEPRFLERTENHTGNLVETYPVKEYGNLMTPEEAKVLQKYMRAVVEDGTASILKSKQYQAAGKTGTAEYESGSGKKSHAWFIGYASGDKPDLAVVVLVEGAGSGSKYAVPIAEKIFETYYN